MSDFAVIGLLGPAGSGKDLVADWFVSKGFIKVAFADPMKRFVAKTFSISNDRLWGPSEMRNEMIDIDEAWWYEAVSKLASSTYEIVNNVLTPDLKLDGYLKLHAWFTDLHRNYPDKISARVILQTLGSEWGRAVDPLMWARYAHRIVSRLSTGESTKYKQDKDCYSGSEKMAPGVIIPDHRFRNEVELTHQNGGHVIRLNRVSMKRDVQIGIAGHRSEAEHKDLPDSLFHAVYNLPEGVDKVHDMLETTYEDRPWEWAVTKPGLVDGYVTVDYNPDFAAIV